MKNETPEKVWKRFCMFGILLLAVLWVLDRTAYKAQIEEEKSQSVMEALEDNKILSDELNVLFKGVQDDIIYFEKEILYLIKLGPASDKYLPGIDTLIKFLETHSGYFMVRLTDKTGKELFKLVEKDRRHYQVSSELIDLSDQPFYQELNSVRTNDFFFSSMDRLVINGVVVEPLRPTIRISKRVEFGNNDYGLFIFNIDGDRILELFSPQKHFRPVVQQDKALLDGSGKFVASYPMLATSEYVNKIRSIDEAGPGAFNDLKNKTDNQGSLIIPEGLLVFSKIILPGTNENWFLVTKLPFSTWEKEVNKKRMTWIFWGLLCFVILMFWYWKHENKRYKDEVLEVLLKERNEFIQNVSHQLKTPLAIMNNSLSRRIPTEEDWNEFRKETIHLIKVVDDMLLLALVDANPDIPLKQEDILEIISDSIVMVGPKSKERNISIRLNVDEKLYHATQALERPVMGDLLKSAIMNLLDNALDFSPRDGVVDIFVTTIGRQLKIQIKDTGPGIPEDLLPHLFKRFTRGKQIVRKGSGLGLSITRKIIELHRGDIRVSEYKNGATFEITLSL